MSSGISALAIQNMQVGAALLMGYDYFLSSHLKAKADAAVTAYMRAQHDLSAKQISIAAPELNQIRGMLAALVICLAATALSMLGAWALFRLKYSPWFVVVMSIAALFFIAATFMGIAKLLTVLVGPRAAPAIFLPLAKFLLFSSKGVIAALGFLLLIASFVCRYLNELR